MEETGRIGATGMPFGHEKRLRNGGKRNGGLEQRRDVGRKTGIPALFEQQVRAILGGGLRAGRGMRSGVGAAGMRRERIHHRRARQDRACDQNGKQPEGRRNGAELFCKLYDIAMPPPFPGPQNRV